MNHLKLILSTFILLTCFSCKNGNKDSIGNYQENGIVNDEKSICSACGKEVIWSESYYWTYNENLSPQDKLTILQIGSAESYSDVNGEIHKGIGSDMPYNGNSGKYIKGVFCSYQCAQNNFKNNEPAPPSKEIEWADGNTYSYDYTEEVELKDSTGTKTLIIYMRNKPTNVDCEVVECRWCRKKMEAEDYSIVEFPDMDVFRGKASLMSFASFYASFLDHTRYFDLDNNKVRTEWKVNCDYGGPDGFCSLKCKSEYNRR